MSSSSISRRALLASFGVAAGVGLVPRLGHATLVRGMTLSELVGRSQHVLVGTPLAAECRYLTIGGRRMLITETRLRVEGVLALQAPPETELVVRTLGGHLGREGELVHGQAQLTPGARCAAFFERAPDGACWVTGMAQGHYPLENADGSLVLRASPQLPTILQREHSAVKRLAGIRLEAAERAIAEVNAR